MEGFSDNYLIFKYTNGISASKNRVDSTMNHDMEIPCFFIFLTTLG